MKNKSFVAVVLLLLFLLPPIGISAGTGTDSNLLVQGLEAYRQEDWSTALFFLRKASTLPENLNAETWYVLIMSEIFAGDYESVETDGEYFVKTFPNSSYMANVEYQMARAWFNTGEYQKAIDSFGSFCAKYSENSLVPSALFWMAESLYQTFNFEEASAIFERIVTDFPSSPKVVEAAFRLDLLSQREREEKLLYLLRVTGEEYLAAKEEYEKLIKQYQSEEAVTLRRKIRDLTNRVEELETQLGDEQKKNSQLSSRILDITAQYEQLQVVAAESAKAAQQSALAAEQAQAQVQAANAATAQANAEAAAASAQAAAANAAADAAIKAAETRPLVIYQNLPQQEYPAQTQQQTSPAETEVQPEPQQAVVEQAPTPVPSVTAPESDEELKKLKEKAQKLQDILNARNGGK
ncbi:MAG: outer membrane protein assembly factor BamD [Treponemataceae bacterium]|nr:outer membrane protein assembly factor BamD [Treponemataceae bacterium]